MTVSFPTDKTQPFQADNGVIYAWDENRWRVKAFRSVDDFLVIIDDNPPDPAKIGDLWYDSKPDELTLYLYTGAEWVPAAPPVSLDGINATIEAALIVQNDLLNEQAVQNSQINALETQIQLLAQVKAVGRWTYRRRVDSGPRPPAIRTFYGTDVRDITAPLTSWEHTNLLMISKTDLDDNNFTFSDFEEGDKVEVIAKDGSSAVYGTITNDPNVDAYGNMVIDVERWRGGPVEEAEYLISAYRPGSSNSNVDLDVLDGRYLVKTDANVVNPNFRIKSDSKVYISTAGGELALNNIKEPTSSHHAATKSYVDSQIGIGIAPPAPLRWIWRQYDSTIDPGEGKFAWYSSSGFFRINYISADGVNLGKSRPSSKDISFSTPLIGSIWYKDGDGWKLKQMFDINRMQWDRNDCMWFYRKSIIVGADGFTADVQYHITVGGLF